MDLRAHSLANLTEHASRVEGVRRDEMCVGDVLLMYTQNSVYSARLLVNGMFLVSGGWFSLNGSQELVLGISGCTWGGKCILTDLVASPGMRVEFSNRVVTSLVKRVVKVPNVLLN